MNLLLSSPFSPSRETVSQTEGAILSAGSHAGDAGIKPGSPAKSFSTEPLKLMLTYWLPSQCLTFSAQALNPCSLPQC